MRKDSPPAAAPDEHPITAYRREHKLSLKAFAERLGMSHVNLWQNEAGQTISDAWLWRAFIATEGRVTPNDVVFFVHGKQHPNPKESKDG